MRLLINAWRDIHHPLAGGSEVLVDELARGLTARGHHVTLRTGRPISEHEYAIKDAGGRFGQYLRTPTDYARHHRDSDLVVDVANGMTYFTPLFRRGPTICFVHHVHTEHWAQWFRPPLAALGRNLELHATPRVYRNKLFVAVSPSTARSLEAIGVRPENIRIVHNGVDVPDRFAPKRAEPTFLALGRLVPHKRYDVLARLWKRVQPHTGGRLLIAGSGPEKAKIEAVGAPAMQLLGKISETEKDRLLGESWLLLHPSSLEGWGLVVLEAAARATPSIGFDAPGVRDSVIHGATGLLSADEDSFVEQWIALAQDNAWRTSLGTAARARAKTFSWERCVDAFEAVALEAIGARVPRRAPAGEAPAARDQPAPVLRLIADTARTPTADTSIVVYVPAADASLRPLLARWRSLVAAERTELIVIAPDATQESLALVDGTLAGFERCRPADAVSDGHPGHTAAVTGRVVVVVDAAAPSGIEPVLAAVPDLLEHATTDTPPSVVVQRATGATIGDVAWSGKPIILTSCKGRGEAQRLVITVAALGHYALCAAPRGDVLVVELRGEKLHPTPAGV
jgi:glycosyltransferase involved in cell wall biosynthesis